MTIFTIAIHTVDPPLYSFPVVAGKKNLLEKISFNLKCNYLIILSSLLLLFHILLETFLHGTRIVLNVVFDKVYD